MKIEEKLMLTFVTNSNTSQQTVVPPTKTLVVVSTPQIPPQQSSYSQLRARLLPNRNIQEQNVLPRRTRSAANNIPNGVAANSNNNFKKIKLSQREHDDDDEESDDDDDGDDEDDVKRHHEDEMSLLEEIVSFNAPDTSLLINEQEHDHHFSVLSSLPVIANDIKTEPNDRPIVEIDESSNSQSAMPAIQNKPWKCDIPGCLASSTTLVALKKHRRRVHNIRVPRSRNSETRIKQHNSVAYSRFVQNDSPGDPIKCSFCQMVLRNQRVLSRHIETVHRQAKFFCTIPGCSHASTRKDNYRLHLKNHHKNLPEDELNQALEMTRNMKPVYINNLTNPNVYKEPENEDMMMQDDESDWNFTLPRFEEDEDESKAVHVTHII